MHLPSPTTHFSYAARLTVVANWHHTDFAHRRDEEHDMPLASIGRRRWLQGVLASAGATLALPRAMADPAAVTPIRSPV